MNGKYGNYGPIGACRLERLWLLRRNIRLIDKAIKQNGSQYNYYPDFPTCWQNQIVSLTKDQTNLSNDDVILAWG